uniref:Uncharacterized protein n=1 Tax=Oryza sativa subsp. japonica TaxID=39947 RepID=Q6EPJ9_ORYSJ|nr:hypothetical protein [Oryza sativa Japonica Group]
MAEYMLRRSSPPLRASSPDAEALRPTSPAAEHTCSRRTPRFSGQNEILIQHDSVRVTLADLLSNLE